MSAPRAQAIGVIGAGAVGQSIATTLMSSQLPGRLLIASRTLEQAEALAADLEDMRQATGASTRPQGCEVVRMHDCEALVIAARAAFTNTRRADIRMAGAAANAPLISSLATSLRSYQGTVVMVTNPVDLMTRLFAEVSGCPRVFGIGANLDSARYRHTLARLLGADPQDVRGHVIGEHGDAAVLCASTTTVNGRTIEVPLTRVREELRTRPTCISEHLGRTRCGPAGAVLSTLHKTLALADGTEELTTAYRGDWLGIPLHFTSGRPLPCLPRLNPDESRQLAAAAAKLNTAYQALQPHLAPIPQETTP